MIAIKGALPEFARIHAPRDAGASRKFLTGKAS
jgi:hypothetical protein